MIKKLITKILAILLAIGVMVLIIISITKIRNSECTGIKVNIAYSGENAAVSEKEVIGMIEANQIATIGVPQKEINTDSIRVVLEKHDYIKCVDKIRFNRRVLTIDITLKDFLLHVFSTNGEQYFIDKEGEMLHFSQQVQERLIIVNGNISSTYKAGKNISNLKRNILGSAYRVALKIDADEFNRAQYREIYINENQEIELIPSVGRVVILFGDESDADEKLQNLQETYRNGLIFMDLDKYSQLDVRYKNRIIAKKR